MVGKAFPHNLRQMFELFFFYREELGVQALLTDVDLDGITSPDIYHACHDREPDSYEAATGHQHYTIPLLFEQALTSLEFQRSVAARLLKAFPEKKRLSFVHIPKSAGSDLSTHLITRYPSLRTTITDPDLADAAVVLAAVKHLVLECAVSDSIYIHGHNHLKTYVEWGAARPQDHVFTTVREPVPLVVSQVNYVLTRIIANETPMAPDTLGWRKLFGIKDPSHLQTRSEVERLARRILRDEGVVPPNNSCHFLGDGTADGAIEQIVRHNVEITDLRRYPVWLRTRWAVKHTTRMNASQQFVSLRDFSPDDIDYINEITREDQAFHRHIAARLDRTGGASLRGAEAQDQAPVHAWEPAHAVGN